MRFKTVILIFAMAALLLPEASFAAPPTLAYRRTIATVSTTGCPSLMAAYKAAFDSTNSYWQTSQSILSGSNIEALEVKPPTASPLATMRVLIVCSSSSVSPDMFENAYAAGLPMITMAPPVGTLPGTAATLGTWSSTAGSGGPYNPDRSSGFVIIGPNPATSTMLEVMLLDSYEDLGLFARTAGGSPSFYGVHIGATSYAPGTDGESERLYCEHATGSTAMSTTWGATISQFYDWSSGTLSSAEKSTCLQAGTTTRLQAARDGVKRTSWTDEMLGSNRLYTRIGHVRWDSTPYRMLGVIRGPYLGQGPWRGFVDTSSTDYWTVGASTTANVDALVFPVAP